MLDTKHYLQVHCRNPVKGEGICMWLHVNMYVEGLIFNSPLEIYVESRLLFIQTARNFMFHVRVRLVYVNCISLNRWKSDIVCHDKLVW